VTEPTTDRALLDGNVMIALAVADHVHHRAAMRWFSTTERFATCPITQGTVLRFLLRQGLTAAIGLEFLAALAHHRGHEFWSDEVAYSGAMLSRVVGHRQVTDAYLAALARHHRGRLATLDAGLAGAHPDVALLVPALPG
jgi:toxin-antitoxin system PIN domain toxin